MNGQSMPCPPQRTASTVKHLPGSWLFLLTGLLLKTGCSPEPLELSPTPAPTAVTTLDSRLIALGLNPAGMGADQDGNGSADNMLPLVLDSLLATVEASAILVLQSSTEDPEQAWAAIEAVLVQSGLPVNTEAYNGALAEGTRTGALCVVVQLDQAPDTSVSAELQLGRLGADGITLDGARLSSFSGTGSPALQLGADGAAVVPYPAEWFSLTAWSGTLTAAWDSAGLHSGLLAGVVPMDVLIDAYLNPIPDSITVGDSEITVPKALIASNVEDELLHLSTESGQPLVDQLWQGAPAISAAWFMEGRPSSIKAP